MISVIDYGAGNLRSVLNGLESAGASHELVHDSDGVRNATKLILPGVGHFGQMMQSLDRLDLRAAILERISAGVPFFGICLGLQALYECSEEAPGERGLGLLHGAIHKFPGGLRIPHMGWNQVEARPDSRLLAGLDRPHVYFANSYYASAAGATATSSYGVEFCAVVERANLYAVQFHPEKSGAAGLRIIHNFVCL